MGPLFFSWFVLFFLLVGSAIRMSTCKDIALCAPYKKEDEDEARGSQW